jgi:coiled-coil domain-containing protein 12
MTRATIMEDAARERRARLAALRQGHVASTESEELEATKTVSLEEKAKEMLQTLVVESGPVGLTELAPRKANWDLKRDLEPKLEKLDEVTQTRIRQIIRDRIAQSSV